MLRRQTRKFGLLHDVLGLFDTSSTGFIVGSYPPNRALPDHQVMERKDTVPQLQCTTLKNGVRVVTQSTSFPTSVHMGVSINAGTRDETFKNSSVVHALKATYLKTNARTNEQINYGMIQMSGGDFEMNYNQEFMNYYGHCLGHDVYDMTQMMSDCVLDEKTFLDEEAAQWRIDEYWKNRDMRLTNRKRLDEVWLTTAYGYNGYGMPLEGLQSNFQNIGFYYMNQFRKQYITPDRMVVWGAGINNHEEFVDTMTPYFGTLDAAKAPERAPSKYLGGEFREILDSELTHVSLGFHGFGRNDKDVVAAYVLKYLIGTTGTGIQNRAYTRFHEKYPWIAYVDPHHATFEDTGNFRINLAVPHGKTGELSELLVKELQDLQNVTEEEVQRAKNKFKRVTAEKLENTVSCMNKTTNDFMQTGKLLSEEDNLKMIDAVTTDQVKNAAKKMLQSYPTLVVLGRDTHGIYTADKFHSNLK